MKKEKKYVLFHIVCDTPAACREVEAMFKKAGFVIKDGPPPKWAVSEKKAAKK